MSVLSVDLDLIRKYNVPGPRYTSYPPATQFTPDVEQPRLLEMIRTSHQSDRDLSLYYHIPFCESLCWFCGCTTVITSRHEEGAKYLDNLDREMAWFSKHGASRRRVVQMHLGGGTPTFLRPDEIRRLGEIIQSHFPGDEEREAGVEIDPRRLTQDHIVALREAGFNRGSMGVQDNNLEVQKAIHRIQPMDLTWQAVEWLRETGFLSVNIDLIYGLPFQTVATFEKTLDEIIELAPDRFAVFNYAHVPWIKPSQKILERDHLPPPEVKFELLKLTIEKLTSAGYIYIGMDHFALKKDELTVAQQKKTLQRNFQGYSTLGGTDIYGFGMSSISQIPGAYWQNLKDMRDYRLALDAGEPPISRGYILTRQDKIRRSVIMQLMCDLSLDYDELSRKLDIDFRADFAQELESLSGMEDDGLLYRRESGLEVTDIGRLVIRNIAMKFDPHCGTGNPTQYSKTI